MKYYVGAHHEDTTGEEWASALTHGLGVLLASMALVWMLYHATTQGDAWHVVTLAVFGAALVAVYLSSMLYHGACGARWRRIMLICDHACIYLLIAGTYTPFALITIGGLHGWILFGVTWGLALVGVLLKLRFANRFQLWSTGLYIAMGWVALTCAGQIIDATSAPGLAWLVGGGVAYTAGVVFYLWQHLPFNHAIWHLFVIAGSGCHVVAVFYEVLPA